MQTAFAYARVSTKDQALKNNSIPEQFSRIDTFSMQNQITITRKFQDSDSAFHDIKRDDFKEMIDVALKERPNYIILDDSSRLARTRDVAIESKKQLRSHGIDILYANEPNVDTRTVAGFWLEGIQEIKNEATSREIAFHVTKGMTRNLQTRDEETGWCYKNGGTPAYGYKTIQLYRGKDKHGKPIYKTIWEIDENTYSITRMIIVDMFTNRQMSYQGIRDYLNNNGIKNSRGGLWSISTISSMLTIDRLEQYNGTAFWNKNNKHVVGVKYNDRKEWTICENAHPKIITNKELLKALERKKQINNNNYKYKSYSDYLLSDKNAENEFLFICNECGGHVIGCQVGGGRSRTYSCGINRHKGACACINNWKVDKEWIEEMIMLEIEEYYTSPKNIENIINNIHKEISDIKKGSLSEIKKLDREKVKIDNQMQNLLNSIKDGLNPKLVVDEVNKLKEEVDCINNKIIELQNSSAKQPNINKKALKQYFMNIQYCFENADIFEKKELIKTFVRKLILNNKDHQISVEFFPDISVVPSVGAGSQNRTDGISLEG